MARFILTIQASVNTAAGAAPVLDIFVNGGFVTSSAAITAVTGVGSDILTFTLDFDDSINDYPSALSFQFSGSSGDGNETITIEAVRINGRALNPGGDLTATILTQAQAASVNALAAKDYLFGRTDPVLGDFGSTTQSGSGTFSGTNGEDVIDGSAGADRIRGLTNDDAINGGAGNDIIYGEGGNDAILGGTGDDKLFGNDGDDMLHGQGDNDTLFGDAGNDLLNGGAGNDVLNGGAGNDVLYGEAGNDRLLGVSGENFMYGDDGDDLVLGGRDNDTMYGGNNNDTLHGANGNDTIYGDSGNDFATGGNGTDTMYGGAGIDRFYGGAGTDTIYGGTENDALYGDEGDDILHGEDGNDMLTGGDGADTLNGGNDNDILHGSGLTAYEIAAILQANPNIVYSEITNSFYQLINTSVNFVTAQSAGGVALLNGVAGHLVTINSSEENAVVDTIAAGNQVWINASDSGAEGQWRWAGGQEDGLLLWNGDQTGSAMNGFFTNWAAGQPSGGALNDAATMLANGTWDDVSALATYRYIIEWDGASLSDDNAADILNGGAGDDLLLGHGGGDTLNGDAGIDHIFGGDGNDTLDARFQTAVPSIADQITAILAGNPGITYSAASGNFYQLVIANVDWDTAVANSAATALNGIAGHLVTITSAGENDFISTMRLGNEIWLGASDRDVEGEWRWMVGPEAGQQFWSGAAAGTPVGGMFENWDSGEPNDYTGGEDYATMWQAGNLWNDNGPPRVAFYGADYVIEWEGSQVLITPPTEPVQSSQYMEGGAGHDTIYGGNVADTIYGDDAAGLETGDDIISAGSGADIVHGGQGDDIIYGQLGSDTLNGNNGNDILYANVDPGLTAIPLNATFAGNEDGFTYADGFPVVGGSDPANVDVTGSWINTDGYTGGSGNGALEININSTNNPTGPISGHYNITVNLTAAMTSAQLSFAYRMFLATNADTGEDLFVYADVNGTQYGVGGNPWVDALYGNLNEGTSGWLTVTLNLGPLAAGSHTIRIGAYVNDVSDNSEDAWLRLDDVSLTNQGTPSEDAAAVNILDGGQGTDTLYGSTGTDTLLGGAGNDTLRSGSAVAYTITEQMNAAFNANEDGFAYADGFPVVGGSDPANIDVTGSWDNTDGYSGGSGNGSILVNFDSTGNPTGPISGHYSITVNLTDAVINGQLSFAYRMFLDANSDNNEDLLVYADIDGTQYGVAPNAWVDSRLGNTTEGDSGWRTVTLDVGSLSAGNHTIRLGGYLTDVNANNEDAWIRFDDVILAGSVVDDSISNRLNGGSGIDQLYGSAGADIFEFDSNGGDAFTSVDTIHDFDENDLDKIDISDILSGLGVNAGNLAQFVDISAGVGVRVDVTGSGSFGAGTQIASFSGTTTLTNEATLLASGQLII